MILDAPRERTNVLGSAARIGRGWWPALILAPLYVLAVGLLFASHVREFADETDNLLGGVLVAHGARLYVDFFSSHVPFAYYLAAVPALFGVHSLDQFRLFTSTLLIASTLGVALGFRRALPPLVLGLWAVLTVYAHTLQFGEMLTAGTCAGYGVLVAGLLFYTTPRLEFSPRQIVALSAATFVAVQSELVAVFPLLLLGLCYVGVRLAAARRTSLAHEARNVSIVLLAVAVPHTLVLLAFWSTGILGDFVYDAYQFNQTYYSQFLMNSSVLGILHDWEAQYRTYLSQSLHEPFGVQSCLVLANLCAAWVVYRSRGLPLAVIYYAFVALTHVRNEGAYYVCSYFSLALDFAWAVSSLRTPSERWRVWRTVGSAVVLLLMADFVLQVALIYDFSHEASRPTAEVDIVQALTEPGERIFVAPFDPYIYLGSERLPASRFSFFFPWQAIDPRIESELFGDLTTTQPALVVFRRNELVNDRWLVGDYGKRLYDFLIIQGYAPLDASSPTVGDVLVPKDRLISGRERLGLKTTS